MSVRDHVKDINKSHQKTDNIDRQRKLSFRSHVQQRKLSETDTTGYGAIRVTEDAMELLSYSEIINENDQCGFNIDGTTCMLTSEQQQIVQSLEPNTYTIQEGWIIKRTFDDFVIFRQNSDSGFARKIDFTTLTNNFQ